MLQTGTLRRLREHNWLEIARNESNLSDTTTRLRSQSDRAINEFVLLATKLPNENQSDIFSYKNVGDLIKSILRGNNEGLHHYSKAENKGVFRGDNVQYDHDFDSRITHLAALLVKEGVNICISQYKTKVEQDSRLNQAIIDKLNAAVEACDAIAFKLYSPAIESIEDEENLVYLFNWNEITTISVRSFDDISGNDNRKLVRFLKEKLGRTLNRLIEERLFEINGICIKKY